MKNSIACGLLALTGLGVFDTPLHAQTQLPLVAAEQQNPVAATLPVIDIATQGEQILVATFAWTAPGNPVSDSVVTLITRDANAAIIEETISQIHSAPSLIFQDDFSFLEGPRLVDVTPSGLLMSSTTWSQYGTGGLPVFHPDSTAIRRLERQTNGTWLATTIGTSLTWQHPVDLEATDDLVAWTAERYGVTGFHTTFVASRTVYAIEPASTPSGWTQKEVATYLPAQSGAPRVATDGDIVVIGLEEGTGPSPTTSHVEIHARGANGQWGLVQSLTPSGAMAGDRFGCDVSIDGNRLVAAAIVPGTSTIVAYVFERAPGTTGPWSEVASLVPPLPHLAPVVSNDPVDVVLARNRVVIGQPSSDQHAPGSGSADVFMRSPTGTWEHSVYLAPRTGASGAFTSMDAAADRVVAATATSLGVYDIYDFGSLLAVGDGPSLSVPAPQTLAIDEGGENAGDAYVLLGSLSGTSPGLPVPGTPFVMPLVADAYFEYSLLTVGGGGVLSAPLGFLDSRGRATCDLVLPSGLPAGLAGLSIHHAAVIIDVHAAGMPATHVTNAVRSVLLP